MKKRPEKTGQELLGVFSRVKLAARGAAIREAVSGIGFVDVLITFSSGLLHVVELKMLKGSEIPGPSQLATYMAHKNRRDGWLVLFDSRRPSSKTSVPNTIIRSAGTIHTVVVDINPLPPSRQA